MNPDPPDDIPPKPKPQSDEKLIAFAIVGAVAAVVGDNLLRQLPPVPVAAAYAVAIAGLIWFWRQRSRSAVDTVGQVLVVALVSSTASHGATRLYHTAPRLLLAIGIVGAIVVIATVRYSRKKVSAPGTTYPDAATPSGSSHRRR